MKRFILFLMVVVISIIIFCGYWLNYGRYKTVDFSHLNNTNRITVSIYNVNDKGTERELCKSRIIDDAMRVNATTSKFQTYTNYWQYERFSPPSASFFQGRLTPVQIDFFKDEELQAIVTIGYLERFGYFLQHASTGGLGRHLNVEELEEIMDLIEIDKEVVDNQIPCN